jgi:hypothetical protein
MLTPSRLKSSINRIIGRFLTNRGYQIKRSERIAGDKLNLLELGFALISSQVDGPLRVVQIGAYDGSYDDPLCGLMNGNVDALLVEPQKEVFDLLQRKYFSQKNIRCINKAVAAHRDDMILVEQPVEDGDRGGRVGWGLIFGRLRGSVERGVAA